MVPGVLLPDQLAAKGAQIGSAAAYATFAVIAIGSVSCWVGGILGDRWGRTRTTATMMAVSGSYSLPIGLLFASPTWLVLLVGLIWGFAVVADSPGLFPSFKMPSDGVGPSLSWHQVRSSGSWRCCG